MDAERAESANVNNSVEVLLNEEVPEPKKPVVVVRKPKRKRRRAVCVKNMKYRLFRLQKV